ncbi:MAG: hypothetical protein WDZ84_02680 [Rhodovibrionaceae bacterium]
MRVLFAAGSFSSGGIADYGRLLAHAFQTRGHSVAFLALADPGGKAVQEERLTLDAGEAPLLRLPAGRGDAASTKQARDWIAGQQSDWVSLQFNPFALQPRGFLWEKRRELTALLRGLRLQIMVHEIWLGIADQRGWKPRLLGRLQKPAITGLLRDLRPRLLQTSNPYYQDLLGEAGLAAGILPLYGNLIPVQQDRQAELRLLGESDGAESTFRLGLFSGQRGERLPSALILELRDYAAERGQRLAVYSAGRAPGIDALFEGWRRHCPEAAFTVLGEQPEAELSRFMQAMDAALTHYPYYLCGKSGVAAAWLEHGVPLLTTWGDLTPGEAPVPPDVLPLLRHPGEPPGEFLARQGPRQPRGHRLAEVADQLLEEMEAADSQASKS